MTDRTEDYKVKTIEIFPCSDNFDTMLCIRYNGSTKKIKNKDGRPKGETVRRWMKRTKTRRA